MFRRGKIVKALEMAQMLIAEDKKELMVIGYDDVDLKLIMQRQQAVNQVAMFLGLDVAEYNGQDTFDLMQEMKGLIGVGNRILDTKGHLRNVGADVVHGGSRIDRGDHGDDLREGGRRG